MANNPFTTSPLDAQLDREEAALATRRGIAKAPSQQATKPETPKGQPNRSALAPFEALSGESSVPVNILLAVAERRGAADPEAGLMRAKATALRLGKRAQAGEDIEALVIEEMGGEDEGRAVLGRAKELGAQLYPDMPEMPAKKKGTLGRLGQAFEQGEATAISQTNEFMRDAAAALEESAFGRTLNKLQRAVGSTDKTPEESAAEIRGNVSPGEAAAKAKLEELAQSGFEVTDWKDIKGLGSLTAFVTENIAMSLPQMGATMAAGPMAGPIGIAMLGAEANSELKERTDLTEGDRVAIATGAGTAMWAFESIGLGKVFGGLVPSQVAKKAMRGELADHLTKAGIKRAAARVIEAGIVEGSTEAIQEGIVMGTTGLAGGDYERGEVIERLTAAFAGGAGAGAGIRAGIEPVQTAREMRAARGQGDEPPADETGAAPAAPSPAPEPAAPAPAAPAPVTDQGTQPASQQGEDPFTGRTTRTTGQVPARATASELEHAAFNRMVEIKASMNGQTMPDGSIMPPRGATPDEVAEWKALKAAEGNPEALARHFGVELKGRMETALDETTPQLFPELGAGQQVEVISRDGEVYEGQFVGEGTDSITFSFGGERVEIPKDEFANGGATLTRVDGQATQPASPQAEGDVIDYDDQIEPPAPQAAADPLEDDAEFLRNYGATMDPEDEPQALAPEPTPEPAPAPARPEPLSEADAFEATAQAQQDKAPAPAPEPAAELTPEPEQATKEPSQQAEAPQASNASADSPSGYDYPNRKLGLRNAASDVDGQPSMETGAFGAIALANMQPGDTIRGIGTVKKVTEKQIHIEDAEGKLKRFSVDSTRFEQLVRDVGGLVEASQHGVDTGSVLDAIKRDPAFSYADGIPQLSDTVTGTKDGPNNSMLKPLTPPAEPAPQAEASDDAATEAPEPSDQATKEPSEQAAKEEGQGERASEPYMLANALSTSDQRFIAGNRESDLGELFGRLDQAARRLEGALRIREGGDIRDYDERGRDAEGNPNQYAHGIREAEALAKDLLALPGIRKRKGQLEYPPFDEDTGEFDAAPEGADEAALVYDALTWLDSIEAQSIPINDADAMAEPSAREEGEEGPDLSEMPDDKLFVDRDRKETVTFDTDLKKGPFISPEDGQAAVDFWKKVAREIGKSGANKGRAILSLFDYTGTWSQPWRDAGYAVIQLDIKTDSNILRDEAWIMQQIEDAREQGIDFAGVLAATPCTTFTSSGNRWRDRHDLDSPEALAQVFGQGAVASGAKSALEYNVMLVDATKRAVKAANPSGFHVLENPIGRIRDKADMPHALARFHPHNFGATYEKATQLFGTFEADMPVANVYPKDGTKMQSELRGSDPLGKEQRSITPTEFAYAFFMANDPEARKRMGETPNATRTYTLEEAEAQWPKKPAAGGKTKDETKEPSQQASKPASLTDGVELIDKGEGIATDWEKTGIPAPTEAEGKAARELMQVGTAWEGQGALWRVTDQPEFGQAATGKYQARVNKADESGAFLNPDANYFREFFLRDGQLWMKTSVDNGKGAKRATSRHLFALNAVPDRDQANVPEWIGEGPFGDDFLPGGKDKAEAERMWREEPERYAFRRLQDEFRKNRRRTQEAALLNHGTPGEDSTFKSQSAAKRAFARLIEEGIIALNKGSKSYSLTKEGKSRSPQVETKEPSQQATKEQAEANPFDAAAQDVDPNPTDAQKEAGNYQKGRVNWNRLALVIETAKGTERSGTDQDGNAWSVTMPAHYGDIKGYTGADGDPMDFYMGDMPDSDFVLIVNQVDPETGAFDEHKVILGTGSEAEARRLYEAGFSDGKGRDRIGSATPVTVQGFKVWLDEADLTQPTEPVKAKPQAKAAPEPEVTDAEIDAATDEAFAEVFGDDAAPEAEVAQDADPVTAALRDGMAKGEVTHLTKKNKTLRGIIIDGTLAPDQAKSVDKYAFRKDGGWFIRADDAAAALGEGSATLSADAPQVIERVQQIGKVWASERERAPEHHTHDLSLSYRPEPEALDVLTSLYGKAPFQPAGTSNFFEFRFSDLDKRRAFIAAVQAYDGTLPQTTEAAPEPTVTETVTPEPAATATDPEEVWDSASTEEREALLKAGGWAKADGSLTEAGARNIARDWKDLTDTAKAKVKAGQGAPRSAGEAAKSAASNAMQGMAQVADAFTQLFGGDGKTTLGSGLNFDKERYEQAKPIFIEGIRHLGMAGADIKDMVVALIRTLQGMGVPKDAIYAAQPYMKQFVKDVKSGEIDISAEASTLSGQQENPDDDTAASGSDSDRPLDDVPSGGDSELAGGRAGDAGGGRGRSGDAGDGSAGTNRGGSQDGVDGREAQHGADRPAGDRGLSAKRAGENPGNFTITPEFALGEGTDGQKLKANLAAIRLVRELDTENRYATPEEQETLARYTGWGGLRGAFDARNEGKTDQWGRAYAELKELLTEAEWNAAFASTRNAHYTAREVVSAMWEAMGHVGFKGGRALEPTVGSGNFLGLQPEAMAGATEWYAAELDSITGRIAKHLYPKATVLAGVGFEQAPFAEGVFDIAIGNPPFGDNKAEDPRRPALDGMKIHNYIAAKTGLHLRPGGIMGMVITHRFLDTPDAEGRAELAKRFKFLGAVRLPNDAFAKNAGTSVTTDIVYFQRLKEGEKPDMGAAWLDTNGALEGGIRLNRYFAENPGNILGRSAMDGEMYARRNAEGEREEYTVHSDGRDLGAELPGALRTALADAAGALGTRSEALDAVSVELATSDMPIGGMKLVDGKVMRREDNDAQGGAVVQELTPQSLWAEDARPYEMLHKTALQLLNDSRRGIQPDEGIIQTFQAYAATAHKADGSRKEANDKGNGGPTKAEQAVYDILDALRNPQDFKMPVGAEADIEAALERKRLGEKRHAKLRGLLDLRGQTLGLIQAERANAANIEELRAALNEAYDAFQKAEGYIGDSDNVSLLQGDVGVELGLEADYTPRRPAQTANPKLGLPARKAEPSSAEKAAILSKRVFHPYKAVDHADNAFDGLSISLSERGKADLPYIAKLTGQSVKDVIEELSEGEKPSIFYDPDAGTYIDADSYLSGNVKAKLDVAQEAGLEPNVKALTEALPEDVPQDRITPTIRSQWLPREVFAEFLEELGYKGAEVTLIPRAGILTADGGVFRATDFGNQFNDENRSVIDLFNAAAAGKAITVRVSLGDGKTAVDEEASKKATAMSERMAKAFIDWVYMDERRAEKVVAAYNEKMNTHRPRKYDGVTYLKTVGANPEIELRRTQKNAAWRMVQSPSVMLDHVVGAGKTYTAITGIMERKRLGLSRKPMVVVPNHLVLQWAREWYELYPGARILAATPADFTAKNRRRLFARIATGDYDAVIIGHSSLMHIETPRADEQALIEEKLRDLRWTMEEAKRQGESKRTMGQMATRIENFEKKLKKLADQKRDEIGIDFEDMGIDHLTVDEAHEFKNLQYATTGEQVVGMNDPQGSNKAFDLYAKLRGMQSRGGAVAFATGTPVSNSLVELFTMLSYLSHAELKTRNQDNFDAWASAYAVTETRMEYTATQQLKPRRVLASLANLQSLGQLYEQVADVINMDKLKAMYTADKEAKNREKGTNERTEFPVPKVKGGGRQLDSAPLTDIQREYMDYLVARMQAYEGSSDKKAYASIDNPLVVQMDARKMSLDIRVVDPLAERDADGKVMRAAAKIKATYDAWADDKGTQLVFCDLSTPSGRAAAEAGKAIRGMLKIAFGAKEADKRAKAMKEAETPFAERWAVAEQAVEDAMEQAAEADDGSYYEMSEALAELNEKFKDTDALMLTADTGFSVYDDLRTVLIEQGIPAREIAFIHDYDDPKKKLALFGEVNEGRVRVLMGSSQKMGAGTNAQKRLVALHHMDAPWRPSDVEQREGRIIRQGNMLYARDPENFEVEITSYSTEGSADTVMWQVLERKAAAIEQFRATGIDYVEEDGADSDQYAEFMASSTGNPVFRYKLEAERDAQERRAEINGLLMARSAARKFMRDYEADSEGLTNRLNELVTHGLGAIEYKGKSGGASEFDAAMKAALAAYKDEFAAWTEAEAAYDAHVDELAAAGVTHPKEVKDRLKAEGITRPKRPAEPSPVSAAVTEASDYAATVKTILDAAGELRVGQSIAFKMGDVRLRIDRQATPWIDPDASEFVLKATFGRLTLEIETFQGAKPINSGKMQKAMTPEALGAFRKREIDTRRASLDRLEADRARHEKTSKLPVDTAPRDEAEARLSWYIKQVRLAETKAAEERALRPNRYIPRDQRRNLSAAQSDAEPHTYDTAEIGGTVYDLERKKVKDSGWNSGYLIAAKRAEDGRPAVVTAKNVDSKPGELEFTDVEVMPEGAREYRRKKRAKGTSRAERAANALQERLADMGLSSKATLQVVEAMKSTVDGKDYHVDGYQWGRTIAISLDAADPNFVFDHEALHFFKNPGRWGDSPYGVFTKQEWQALVASARSDKKAMEKARREYSDLPASGQIEEVIANQFAAWMRGRRPVGSRVSRAFQRLRGILTAIRDAVMLVGISSRNDIFAQLESGALTRRYEGGRREPLLSRNGGINPRAMLSRRAESDLVNKLIDNAVKAAAKVPGKARALGQGARYRMTKEGASNALTDAMGGQYSALGLVPGRALFSELGKHLSSAKRYLRIKEEMDALRNEWHARTDRVAQEWRRLIKSDPEANERMMDLMHRSTISQIDPAGRFKTRATAQHTQMAMDAALGSDARASAQAALDEDARRLQVHTALRAEFDALPRAFQELYRTVRDEYAALANNYEDALLDNMRKAADRAYKQADRTYKQELRDIEDDDTLTVDEQVEANQRAKEKLEKAKSRSGWTRQAKIAGLRAQFEMNRLKGPYFPLARYGQYFVTLRNVEGELESFSLFETVREQKEFIKEKEAEGFKALSGVMSNAKELKGAIDGSFVAQVEEILGDADVPTSVMDEVWQRYLETLPDLSIRTNRIHRKNRRGYLEDAYRAFGKKVFHGSHQLARLTHAADLEEALENAREEALVAKDPNRAGHLVNEMARRHEFTMNPTGASWAATATSAAFVWYLSVTPAAALVNISQTSVLGIPILGAAFEKQGVAVASKELGKALVDFGRGKGNAMNSKRLKGDERAALEEAYRRGTIDKTQSHDLAGVAESGVEYSDFRARWMARISWLFHNAEVLNREVTFLAAYRMAKAEGMDHDTATDKAAELTWKTHFDYQNTSRPRIMQGDTAKVLTVFRSHTVNMLWRLFRDSHQALNGASEAERREAKRQLIGITGSMALHAGLTGTWGYGIVMAIIAAATGEDDDELEQKMKAILVGDGENALRRHVAGMMLNGVPGHVSGISLTERIGMPNLWFRDSYKDLEGKDQWLYFLEQLAGPVFGIGGSVMSGLDNMSEGEFLRGAEQAVPKFARDLLRAGRYASEGVQTWKGDPILEELSLYQIGAQALGFTPAEVAERYASNSAAKGMEIRITERRSKLLAEVRNSIIGGDGITPKLREKLAEWNRDVPEYPIRRENIEASINSRRRSMARNEGGVQLNPKLNDRIRRQIAKPIY